MQGNGKLKAIRDLFFPPLCMLCGKRTEEGGKDWICGECFGEILSISSPICPRCGLPFDPETGKSRFCQDCLMAPPLFGRARSLGLYEKGLRKAIVLFKYRGKVSIGENLGRLLAERMYPGLTLEDHDLLMPVPLHSERLRERGFNQALVLAAQLGKRHRIPVDALTLRRVRPTESQITLGLEERAKNVKGAFEVNDRGKVKGKAILLIDDVYTSGSTARECVRVLRKAGAGLIDVLTLARAA